MKNRTSLALLIVLVLLVVYGGLFARPHHPVFPWHDLPGHMAVIGLAGCIVVVLLSKWLGKKFLQKPEDYDER